MVVVAVDGLGLAPALEPAAQLGEGRAVAGLAGAAAVVVDEVVLGLRAVLPLGLAPGHGPGDELRVDLAGLEVLHGLDHQGVADALLLPALQEHVALVDGPGVEVEGVVRGGQVHGPGVGEQEDQVVAHALVEHDLVEVGARVLALAQEVVLVVAAGGELAAPELAVRRPARLVLPGGEVLVVRRVALELGGVPPAARGGADAEVAEVDVAVVAVPGHDVEGQVVPGREEGPQEQRGLGALEVRRGEGPAVGRRQGEGLVVGVPAGGVGPAHVRDPEAVLVLPGQAGVRAPGDARLAGVRGVRIEPRVPHVPDLGLGRVDAHGEAPRAADRVALARAGGFVAQERLVVLVVEGHVALDRRPGVRLLAAAREARQGQGQRHHQDRSLLHGSLLKEKGSKV